MLNTRFGGCFAIRNSSQQEQTEECVDGFHNAVLFLFGRSIHKGAGYTSECSFADALYAFKRRGFGGEIGVVCSERLRAGYTSAYPAPIPAFLAYLFTPCDDIHFPISHIAGPNHCDCVQCNCNFPPWRSILIAIAVGIAVILSLTNMPILINTPYITRS